MTYKINSKAVKSIACHAVGKILFIGIDTKFLESLKILPAVQWAKDSTYMNQRYDS
jgi:hypothetical protein